MKIIDVGARFSFFIIIIISCFLFTTSKILRSFMLKLQTLDKMVEVVFLFNAHEIF